MNDGKVVGYYNLVSGSWGWQADAESYACVVVLMGDRAVRYLTQSKGWGFGVGLIVLAGDVGAAKILTCTLKKGAYEFFLDQLDQRTLISKRCAGLHCSVC